MGIRSDDADDFPAIDEEWGDSVLVTCDRPAIQQYLMMCEVLPNRSARCDTAERVESMRAADSREKSFLLILISLAAAVCGPAGFLFSAEVCGQDAHAETGPITQYAGNNGALFVDFDKDVPRDLRVGVFRDPDELMTFRRALKAREVSLLSTLPATLTAAVADPASDASRVQAFMDDEAPGWRALTSEDFAHVNSAEDTWSWNNGVLHCTGQPVSVLRTVQQYRNFELVVEWMHEKPAGNSGVFLWTTPESIATLTEAGKPGLPKGIEVQILDHGFTELMKQRGQRTDWFGTNGDVFPVGVRMTPFPPLSPDGSRSFPRKHLAKGHGEWNHYYIRAINGEVRLWVNGEEVSGGTGCDPASGYLCLESEGSPIIFRRLRIRELP